MFLCDPIDLMLTLCLFWSNEQNSLFILSKNNAISSFTMAQTSLFITSANWPPRSLLFCQPEPAMQTSVVVYCVFKYHIVTIFFIEKCQRKDFLNRLPYVLGSGYKIPSTFQFIFSARILAGNHKSRHNSIFVT